MNEKHQQNMTDYMKTTNKNKNSQLGFSNYMKVYDTQIEYFYSNGDYNSALDYTLKVYEQLRNEKIEDKEVVK